ncbi:MAG: Si-specific NAD(P)(+) transhydrogenase [Deltaproteobacteria bacterium]|nr:Si-specific NAD(P)(+) transhydrogenase [Deltaproteobacteria bacterium]
MKAYDVLVIGSGPAGQKGAIQAAKLGKRVAVFEKEAFIGGAGLQTGTIPSKTLRETALYLSGLKQRSVYGFQCILGKNVQFQELMHRKETVVQRQMEVIIDQFARNNVEIIYGTAVFEEPHILRVKNRQGETERFRGEVILVTVGSRPNRPPEVPFDGHSVYDSDGILKIDTIPDSLTIIGGGVIGCEYASVFACLGTRVTIVEKKDRLLGFADEEIVNSLVYWMRHAGIAMRLGEGVDRIDVEHPGRVVAQLAGGKQVVSEKLLFTLGRNANTKGLGLEEVGVKLGKRGRIEVDSDYRTNISGIFAAGDVIGGPSLASTSMEQGRQAMCAALMQECPVTGVANQLPYGIYTIPEISMFGETEAGLTEQGIPYEIGQAFFSEVARGQIIGDSYGMLKLLFHRETRKLLGIHIIGERATEIIHIGQAVMSNEGTIDYFVNTVFNYPTLSDAYKVAALNGINRL